MKRNYKTTPGQKIDDKIKSEDRTVAVLALMYIMLTLGAIVGICLKS